MIGSVLCLFLAWPCVYDCSITCLNSIFQNLKDISCDLVMLKISVVKVTKILKGLFLPTAFVKSKIFSHKTILKDILP